MFTWIINYAVMTCSMHVHCNTDDAFKMFELPGDIVEVVCYDRNGAITQRGYLLDGKKTGEWISYNLDGNIAARAFFENGEKEGKWKVYDSAGNLQYKILYKDNLKVWAQAFDSGGSTTQVAVR